MISCVENFFILAFIYCELSLIYIYFFYFLDTKNDQSSAVIKSRAHLLGACSTASFHLPQRSSVTMNSIHLKFMAAMFPQEHRAQW